MVELNILSGKKAGSTVSVHRFPWRIGRAASAELRLEEEGVWDQHLEVHKDPAQGFILKRHHQTAATLNGDTFEEALLRNGDVLSAGQVKMQFWLSQPRQQSVWPREALTWIVLALLCAGQVALIYWLVD